MRAVSVRRVNVENVFRWPSCSHAVLADGHIHLSGVMGTVGPSLELADGGAGGQLVRRFEISSRC
jgi:hypothetical protein